MNSVFKGSFWGTKDRLGALLPACFKHALIQSKLGKSSTVTGQLTAAKGDSMQNPQHADSTDNESRVQFSAPADSIILIEREALRANSDVMV